MRDGADFRFDPADVLTTLRWDASDYDLSAEYHLPSGQYLLCGNAVWHKATPDQEPELFAPLNRILADTTDPNYPPDDRMFVGRRAVWGYQSYYWTTPFLIVRERGGRLAKLTRNFSDFTTDDTPMNLVRIA